MNISRLKLITFDITGTLLQFKHPIGKFYCDIAALFNVKCNEDKMNNTFKNEWKKMILLHPNFGKRDIGWRKWWTLMVCNCFKDINVDETKGTKIANYLIDQFTTMECWKITDGALDLLSYLKSKQICLGVISNSDERLETILFNAKLQHHFKFVIYSYGVDILKPDINIFKLAMKKSELNTIQPYQCLHIGDNLELDFVGAKNAGWKAILISQNNIDLKTKYNITEDEIFHNICEIKKQLVNTI